MLDILIAVIICIACVAHQWDHARLPIIGMNDVRPPVNEIDHVQHCSLEESKTLAVILIAIQSISFKIRLMFNEIISDISDFACIVGRRLIDPAAVDLHGAKSLQFPVIFLNDLLIQRQHHAHIMAALSQCFRQRPDHICQTACFNKRQSLTSHKQY